MYWVPSHTGIEFHAFGPIEEQGQTYLCLMGANYEDSKCFWIERLAFNWHSIGIKDVPKWTLYVPVKLEAHIPCITIDIEPHPRQPQVQNKNLELKVRWWTTTTEGPECLKWFVGSLKFDLLTWTNCEQSASTLEPCSLDLTAGGWVGGWVGQKGEGSGRVRIMKRLQIENEPPISDGSLQNRAHTRCLRLHQLFKFYFVICGWFHKAIWKEGGLKVPLPDKLSSGGECALFTSPLEMS